MNRTALSVLFLAAGVAGCSESETIKPTEEGELQPEISAAALANADGENVGQVSLAQTGDQLVLEIQVNGLAAGTKALHLHTTGACDGPDFKSAGGHLNPADVSHGKLSETGPHLGDLPNLEIEEAGNAEVTVELAGLADETIAQIMDADGTAVMIHAGPDDYKSDPAGAAGPRIACGVFS